MQVTDEWRRRLERTYLPFATWATAALVAIVTCVISIMTGKIGVLPVLIPFLCAFPAMMSARLAIAFRRFLRKDWQLVLLASGCGAVTMFSLQLAYLLAVVVSMWDPGETANAFDALTDENLTVSGFFLGSLYFVVPAVAGGITYAGSAGLWLYREWRARKVSATGNEAAVSILPPARVGHDDHQAHLGRRITSEACYFWCTTVFGPGIVSLPLALFANMALGPAKPIGAEQLLWLTLRLYYCGTLAAAVAAVLVLALVFNRRRRSAWLAALPIGLHAGAMLPLLFAPAEGNAGSQVKFLLVCAVIGALSAAACTAIWFPDRRGQMLGGGAAKAGLIGGAIARDLLIACFFAPLASTLAYGLFIGVVQSAGSPSAATFIGRLRSFDLEIWAIIYKVWVVVALQVLALYHLLPMAGVRRPIVIAAIALFAFLFAGAMGQSLDDYVMPKPTTRSIGSFVELGLPGLIAAIAAICLIGLYPMRRSIDVGRAVT